MFKLYFSSDFGAEHQGNFSTIAFAEEYLQRKIKKEGEFIEEWAGTFTNVYGSIRTIEGLENEWERFQNAKKYVRQFYNYEIVPFGEMPKTLNTSPFYSQKRSESRDLIK